MKHERVFSFQMFQGMIDLFTYPKCYRWVCSSWSMNCVIKLWCHVTILLIKRLSTSLFKHNPKLDASRMHMRSISIIILWYYFFIWISQHLISLFNFMKKLIYYLINLMNLMYNSLKLTVTYWISMYEG